MPKSWPHGFTGWFNFCDFYSGERTLYFHIANDSDESAGALREWHHLHVILMTRLHA